MPEQRSIAVGDLKGMLETALDEELESFDPQANFYQDYGLDSMGAVALFVELQRATGVEIDADLAPSLQTGEQVMAYLEAR